MAAPKTEKYSTVEFDLMYSIAAVYKTARIPFSLYCPPNKCRDHPPSYPAPATSQLKRVSVIFLGIVHAMAYACEVNESGSCQTPNNVLLEHLPTSDKEFHCKIIRP